MDQLKVGQRVAKVTRAGGIEFGRVMDILEGLIIAPVSYAIRWDHDVARWEPVPHDQVEKEAWYVGIEAEQLEAGT